MANLTSSTNQCQRAALVTLWKSILPVAMATMLFVPNYVVAQDDDSVVDGVARTGPAPILSYELELGFGYVSEDSFKFGEFSGLEEEGGYFIGNIWIQKRDAYDSDGAKYWEFTGSNLGLESRALRLEYGQQGKYKIFLSYDQIPKFLHDDTRTPFIIGDGGTSLILPAGWVPGNRDTGEMTILLSSLQDVNIHHDRKKFGGGFAWLFRKKWEIKTSFHREIKEGTKPVAAMFGINGGNPASAIVPQPIDYETDQFDAVLAYLGKKGQFELGYHLSLFRNDKTSLTWENPFTGPWAPAASFPMGLGRLSLAPDNKAHQITFSGGYALGATTRVNANIVYGRMTQDDDFLPFTVNPGLIVTTPLPRSSLDGEVETILVNFSISSRPTPKLSLRARYRYNDRDNNTPRDIYIGVRSDSEDQQDIASSTARINLPYSRQQHSVELNASYRVARRAKLSLGYDYEQIERTFSEVEKTEEHTLSVKLQANPSSVVSGWVGLDYSMRNGSEYIGNAAFLASQTPEHLGPDPADQFENHPALRKFFIADREQFKLKASTIIIPNDSVVIGLSGNLTRDDYDETSVEIDDGTIRNLGLTNRRTYSFTADASFSPRNDVTAYAFYTYENFSYDQSGFSYTSFPPLNDLTNFAAQGWTTKIVDKVDTTGAGLDWSVIKDKLDVSVNYTYSKAVTGFDIEAGTALSAEPLPDLKSKVHSLSLNADYKFTGNLSVRALYRYERFNTSDFAVDDVLPDTIETVISLGGRSPNYSVHVIGISSVYRF